MTQKLSALAAIAGLLAPLRSWMRTIAEAGVTSALGLMPDRLRLLVVDRAPFTARLDYPEREIYLNVNSEFEHRVRVPSCSREPETVLWIERNFHEGDVFYDIGANVGAYTLVAAARFNGLVRVCAFEPSAINFSQLVRNLTLNGCAGTVTPLPVALADSTRIDVFNYHNLVSGAALHELGAPAADSPSAVAQVPLLVFTLDDIVERFRLPAPSHIKIDVDGSESAVLAGGGRTLGASSLRTLLIEMGLDPQANQALTDTLVGHGFALAERHPLKGGCANVLFAR
jgi:FkbM family methyltransferase